jgi:hypothetical protein
VRTAKGEGVKQSLFAAAWLFAFAGCAGSHDGVASSALPSVQHVTSNLLYVTDRALKAVIAFDGGGRKIAEYDFKEVVFDVVTDSRGHVYVVHAADDGTDQVRELSHDLSTVIAAYRPSALGFDLAIDADDNLYVEHLTQSGESIYEYPYGSTHVEKVYPIPAVGLDITGISVRDGIIYAPVKVDEADYQLFSCQVNVPASCANRYNVTGTDCGFTTTASNGAYVWYGKPYFIRKIELDQYRGRGKIDLPAGYQPGWAGFCALHNYGHFGWLPITGTSGTGSAQAIEFDLQHGHVAERVGAGVLSKPVAAFYGNGFTP